jgi:hypothetical protein
MNELGDQCTGTMIVAKRISVQFFLDTIDKSSKLNPTPRDCERLFDDIAVNLGVNSSANIDLDKLLQSTLTIFLSYLQILQVIKYLETNSYRPYQDSTSLTVDVDPTFRIINLPFFCRSLS